MILIVVGFFPKKIPLGKSAYFFPIANKIVKEGLFK